MTDPTQEFIAYTLSPNDIRGEIKPANRIRDWQKQTPDSFATRCLPLNIANNFGWEISLPGGFDAVYTGGGSATAIKIYPHGDGPINAISHFGQGTLTFHLGYFFKTPPDVSLLLTGPINELRDGIQPLVGIIETDWSPYGTTMNWKFTRTCRVRFRKGESFAQVAPMPSAHINSFQPRFGNLEQEEPELYSQHTAWSNSRQSFNHDLAEGQPEAVKQKWQKLYYRGVYPDGETKHSNHFTRLDPKPFTNQETVISISNSSENNHWLPPCCKQVTVIIKIKKKIDWRMRRTIDEASKRAAQVLILYSEEEISQADLVDEIPYRQFVLVPTTNNKALPSTIQETSKFEHFVFMAPEYLLPDEFWERMEDYKKTLDSYCDEIKLDVADCDTPYQTFEDYQQNEKRGVVQLKPSHSCLTVLCHQRAFRKQNTKVANGKDKIIKC